MDTKNQVLADVQMWKNQGIPLSDAVWQTALDCVGWPYVFGAWGEDCTPEARRKRARDDHPTIVSSCQVLSGKKGDCAGCKWFPGGFRVGMFDCRGFTYWCLRQFGIDIQGSGATSQWNTESNWMAKGTIDTIPDDLLVCLFVYKKDTGKMEHTGLGYKGQTCECSAGVQHFSKRKSKWTHWALPRGITGDMPDYKPTLKRGSKGPEVKAVQEELIRRGYDLGKYGADGDFGKATEAAVKKFQADNGLKADGIVGQATYAALEMPNVRYTVTIKHVNKPVAEEILKQYPTATMAAEEG